MEIHSACDLLDDETDQSVAAYERLAFGRLSLSDLDPNPAQVATHAADLMTPPQHETAQRNRQPVHISVQYRIFDDHVQYLIQFNPDSRPFITRYSELENFHRLMVKRFPELKHECAFPRKRFWGYYDSKVLKARATQFQAYFCHLTTARNGIYRHAALFREFFIDEQRSKYRQCLVKHDYAEALNHLFPVQDFLESLDIVCADQLVNLSLICLCNWKACQSETANLYSQKTLVFITTNAKTLAASHYASLVSECISIVATIRQHHGDGEIIQKVEQKLLTMRAAYTD